MDDQRVADSYQAEVDRVIARETLRTELRARADAEINAGAEPFMGWPDRWFEAGLRRCINDHVSSTVLMSEAWGRDACLACREHVYFTFPEDVDGPLA